MKGFHFRAAAIVFKPNILMGKNGTEQNLIKGYDVDIFHTIQEQLNFTYTAVNVGSGTRMIDMIEAHELDIIVNSMIVTDDRLARIDFTHSLKKYSARFYLKRSTPKLSWALYALPFNATLWICILLLFFVTGSELWAMNKFGMKLFEESKDGISYITALWATFIALFQQASPVKSKLFSVQFTLLVGCLISLLFLTSYSAVLISILTITKPEMPFQDFEELRKRPDWNLGVFKDSGYSSALMLAPKGSAFRHAWDVNVARDMKNNLIASYTEGLNKALKGKFAVLSMPSAMLYKLQNTIPKEDAVQIVGTGKDLMKGRMAFGLQKRSPFLNVFNYLISKMISTGQLKRLDQKYWPTIDRTPDEVYPSTGVREVITLIVCLSLGILSSMFFLGLEMAWKKRTTNELSYNYFQYRYKN